VNLASDVLLNAAHGFADVLLRGKIHIASRIVRIDLRSLGDVIQNLTLERFALYVRNHFGAHLAALPIQQSHDGNLSEDRWVAFQSATNAQTSQKEIAEDLLEKASGYTATGVDFGDIADVVYMLKRVVQDIHPLLLLIYANELGKKFYFSGGGTFLTGFAAACGYVRNRNNMKMLEGALEKLILLLKQLSEDPLGLDEYQELIKNITSSRGKMMRRLVYDTFLRFFLGTTTRLEWTDAYRSLSLT
jgi:hypothetical protein